MFCSQKLNPLNPLLSCANVTVRETLFEYNGHNIVSVLLRNSEVQLSDVARCSGYKVRLAKCVTAV